MTRKFQVRIGGEPAHTFEVEDGDYTLVSVAEIVEGVRLPHLLAGVGIAAESGVASVGIWPDGEEWIEIHEVALPEA